MHCKNNCIQYSCVEKRKKKRESKGCAVALRREDLFQLRWNRSFTEPWALHSLCFWLYFRVCFCPLLLSLLLPLTLPRSGISYISDIKCIAWHSTSLRSEATLWQRQRLCSALGKGKASPRVTLMTGGKSMNNQKGSQALRWQRQTPNRILCLWRAIPFDPNLWKNKGKRLTKGYVLFITPLNAKIKLLYWVLLLPTEYSASQHLRWKRSFAESITNNEGKHYQK